MPIQLYPFVITGYGSQRNEGYATADIAYGRCAEEAWDEVHGSKLDDLGAVYSVNEGSLELKLEIATDRRGNYCQYHIYLAKDDDESDDIALFVQTIVDPDEAIDQIAELEMIYKTEIYSVYTVMPRHNSISILWSKVTRPRG